MKSLKNFPKDIQSFLSDATVSEIGIGCSDTKVFKIKKSKSTLFLKVGVAPLLTKEYASLIWLKDRLSVPECVYFTNDGKYEYLITKAVAGEMSCSDLNLSRPEATVKLLAESITQIQNVDIKDFPFRNDLNYKLGIAEYNVKNNLLSDTPVSEIGKKFKSYEKILDYLKTHKPKEELVFSHGDTSLPNIFLKNGKVSGFIDVGECGVADKWFDIAICYKSIRRNFPNRPDLLDLFLKELNLKPSSNIDYYIAIMDLYL